jgi:multiple sugar transport system substrate-binding protein
VRDIARSHAARVKANLPVDQYAVCPLPAPAGGRQNGGWVNGYFFVVPRGAKNSAGAWEFMKFWSGVGGHEAEAAEICATGGWIPVSQNVVDQPRFQQYLREQPLFAEFVALAASENQFPIPAIPGAPFFNREIKSVGARAMADENALPQELLDRATVRIQDQVNRARE